MWLQLWFQRLQAETRMVPGVGKKLRESKASIPCCYANHIQAQQDRGSCVSCCAEDLSEGTLPAFLKAQCLQSGRVPEFSSFNYPHFPPSCLCLVIL